MLIVQLLGWIFVCLALCGVVYTLLAVQCAARFMSRPAPPPAAPQPVTLLKALHGGEPGLAENLESFCRQDYVAPLQIVFGVREESDVAIPIAESLKRRFPAISIDIVVDENQHGANAKVSNLINMMDAARYEVLVLADADIRVAPDWLARVLAALETPGTGLVTCFYTGMEPLRANLWSRLAAMGNSYDFLPNAVLGFSLGLATPCFGSTIALRRALLEEIGGFEAFADYLADDYEMGRAVRQKGLGVALPALSVRHMCAERNFREFFRHESRWARTIRLLNRTGYLGSIVTLPVPLALLGAVFLAFSGHVPLLGGLTLGAAVASRLFLKWRIDAIFGTDAGTAWLLPLRDLLSFAVFGASLFGGAVHWRGQRFAVQRGGAMTQY